MFAGIGIDSHTENGLDCLIRAYATINGLPISKEVIINYRRILARFIPVKCAIYTNEAFGQFGQLLNPKQKNSERQNEILAKVIKSVGEKSDVMKLALDLWTQIYVPETHVTTLERSARRRRIS